MAPATVWLNLQHLADQVALIGDPGQIMPWEPDSLFYPGMQGSPIEPLPQLVARERAGRVVELDLPVSRRNPAHTTALTGQLPAYRGNPTRPMYTAQEVPITPAAILLPNDPVNAALTRMIERGIALYPLTGGLPGTDDPLVARACAAAADRLLNVGCRSLHRSPTGVAKMS